MGEGGGSSDACRLRARGRQKHGVRTPPSRVSSILKGSFSKSVSTRRPGECGGREGHLQGQVRHPSVACGDTSPYRGGFWDGGPQKGSPARGAGCAGRRRLRGALPLCGGNTPQGLAGSCPAVHGGSARPRGGRDRPPYIAAENGQRPVNGSQLQRPTAGRCKHRPLRRGRVAAGRMRRPGRALPPCFAGDMWRPGECGYPEGYLQGQVRHPSVACGDTSPCRGGFWDGGPQKGSPARGAGCAGRRRLRGALPLCGGNTPQGLAGPCPRVSQGRAAAGRVRLPGRVFAGPGAAPLRRLRRHLPLQGRLPGRQHTERLPCKGSLSSSGLLKAASPVKERRWRRLPYPSTVTSVRRIWPASQALRSRRQGAGRLPAVRSTRP